MRSPITALILFAASGAALAQLPASTPPSQAAAESTSHQVTASNPDAQWKPKDEQERRVVQAATNYFAARDERRFADAYALFSASQKQVVPFEGWKTQSESFYSSAGKPEGRTIRKVTWYKNPANVQPGIYAAVDFESRFSNLALHCGYVVWRQQMDGSFELVREEENSIPNSIMPKLTPEKLQSIRAQFRC